MNSFFAIFGKVALVLIIGAVLFGGGIYLGAKLKTPPGYSNPTPVPTPPITTGYSQTTPQTIPVPTPSTPTTTPITITSSGGVFISYTINMPQDWTQVQETIAGAPKLTLSKDGYQLIISQGAGGGAMCKYPGEAATDFSTPLNNFVLVNSSSTQFRRATTQGSPTTGPQTYTVCEQKPAGFQLPTQFGYITYLTPQNPTAEVLAQLDSMLASLTKK